MHLQISIRESGGVTVVDLKGKATIGDDNDLLNSNLRKLVTNCARKLLLNMTELTQVDSSSIGTIAGTFVSLSRQAAALNCCGRAIECWRRSTRLICSTISPPSRTKAKR